MQVEFVLNRKYLKFITLVSSVRSRLGSTRLSSDCRVDGATLISPDFSMPALAPSWHRFPGGQPFLPIP